jgi:hypothetical protein
MMQFKKTQVKKEEGLRGLGFKKLVFQKKLRTDDGS